VIVCRQPFAVAPLEAGGGKQVKPNYLNGSRGALGS